MIGDRVVKIRVDVFITLSDEAKKLANRSSQKKNTVKILVRQDYLPFTKKVGTVAVIEFDEKQNIVKEIIYDKVTYYDIRSNDEDEFVFKKVLEAIDKYGKNSFKLF